MVPQSVTAASRSAFPPIQHIQRHVLYRAYLRHLRLLPDPYAWAVLQPYVRSLLAIPCAPLPTSSTDRNRSGAGDRAESSLQAQVRQAREARRIRHLRRARRELYKLQAATACHPHALARLLEEVYAVKGRERWRLINNISNAYPGPEITGTVPQKTNPLIQQRSKRLTPGAPALAGSITPQPPPPRHSLPPPLHPLVPPPPKASASQPNERLRPIPPVAHRRAAKRREALERDTCPVPLVLPPSAERTCTGLEGTGVVEALRALAVLGSAEAPGLQPRQHPAAPAILPGLHTVHLMQPHIRLLLSRSKTPPPSPPPASLTTTAFPHPIAFTRFGTPAPSSTRQNPRSWKPPSSLTPRIVQRAYKALWDKLVWVRPVPVVLAVEKGNTDAEKLGPQASTRWERCTFEQAFPAYGATEAGMKADDKRTAARARKYAAQDGARPSPAVGLGGVYPHGSVDDAMWLRTYLAQKA